MGAALRFWEAVQFAAALALVALIVTVAALALLEFVLGGVTPVQPDIEWRPAAGPTELARGR